MATLGFRTIDIVARTPASTPAFSEYNGDNAICSISDSKVEEFQIHDMNHESLPCSHSLKVDENLKGRYAMRLYSNLDYRKERKLNPL